jgi:PAS domain-containing protein
VLDTVSTRERDLRDKDGRWYSLRLRPYRTLENKIDGVVVLLVDVDLLKRAETALQASEAQLTSELEAMNRLHSLSSRLLASTDLRAALDDVLENAILTSRADFGNVQLYNAPIGALEIVAQRGFRQDFLDYFRTV